ncbi:MAG: zinc metalloprotease [Saprospiraceae bacterium]|nr:zinc metalloprotease [Saprospiraceae bacterium]
MSSCKKDETFASLVADGSAIDVSHNRSSKTRCLTDRQMEKIYEKQTFYRNEITQGREETMIKMQQDKSRSIVNDNLLTIPVHFIVVHAPGQSEGTGSNIPTARILSQLQVLNRDFLRKNPDAAKTPAIFPATNSQIQFCMATRDPNGNATTGISRYATNRNFDDNELQIKGETTWDPSAYLNVWIAPNIEGLGYAYLPSPQSLPARNEDGVVVLTEAFGGPNSGAQSPFDLGRTLTHEVGHYLGLDHIWGEGCSVDDGISDTPQQREENYGCPNHPSPSCGNKGDMFMNYMDYSDDHCLNAFTVGQAAYMRQILNTSRAALVRPGRTSCAVDPDDPDLPTCSDGIKNGGETGVDCGGPDCAPCNTSPGNVDAGITAVRQKSAQEDCSGSTRLGVTIRNFGNITLQRVRIVVARGSSIMTSLNWTGTLPPGAEREIELPAFILSEGNHNLIVRTEHPNGSIDANNSNNATNFSLTASGGNQMLLVIQPDDYAGDISWMIRNEAGTKVASGGGYKDGRISLIKEEICLPNGCYRLIVKDSYGDGICCDYGEGWYELRSGTGDILAASDGYYGYRETQWFCMEDLAFSRLNVERDQRLQTGNRVRKTPAGAIKSLN